MWPEFQEYNEESHVVRKSFTNPVSLKSRSVYGSKVRNPIALFLYFINEEPKTREILKRALCQQVAKPEGLTIVISIGCQLISPKVLIDNYRVNLIKGLRLDPSLRYFNLGGFKSPSR